MAWIPEFFSLFLMLYIPAVMADKREWRLPVKYTILLIAYILHIFIGIFVNSVALGPTIVGMRQFLRLIPVFVLPAVITFDESDMRKLVKFLFILALIQFPVTIWQRFIKYANVDSGDPIGGTLGANTSGVLSIFLLMVLSFMTSYYLKKKMSLLFFIPLCIIVFIPTTLNETKITLPLLPLAILFPVILERKNLTRIPLKVFSLCLTLSIAIVLFISIYNVFNKRNIVQFYSQKEQAGSYSESRIAPILTAIDKVVDGGLKTMIYGYGAGNVSVSYSSGLESKLFKKFSVYNPDNVSITKIIWETGYIGTFLFLLLIIFIFFDCRKFCMEDNWLGIISLGMSASTILLFISFFYTTTLSRNLFIYPFFFLSGCLVVRNNRGLSAVRDN